MKRENFSLRSVKVSSTGVVAVYKDLQNNQNEITERSNKNPHPDLINCLNGLAPFLAETHHLTALSSIRGFLVEESKTKDLKGIIATLDKRQQEILDSLDVRGCYLKGEESNVVIITAVETCKGKSMSINSPRIDLNQSVYGKEDALSESIDELCHEVWEYLFNGKQSQLSMEFNEPDNDEE